MNRSPRERKLWYTKRLTAYYKELREYYERNPRAAARSYDTLPELEAVRAIVLGLKST